MAPETQTIDTQVTELLTGSTRLREIAEEILQLKADRKRLNEMINTLLKEAETMDVPKKAFRLALELWEKGTYEEFNLGYARICEALQLEMEFDQ